MRVFSAEITIVSLLHAVARIADALVKKPTQDNIEIHTQIHTQD